MWQWGVSLVAMVTSRGVPSSFRLAGVQVAFARSGVRVKGERVGALASELERVRAVTLCKEPVGSVESRLRERTVGRVKGEVGLGCRGSCCRGDDIRDRNAWISPEVATLVGVGVG